MAQIAAETWDLIGHDRDVMRSLIELGDAVLVEPGSSARACSVTTGTGTATEGGQTMQTTTLYPIHEYDPDANLETRRILANWVELFTLLIDVPADEWHGNSWDLSRWVQESVSLRDPRLTALTACRDSAIGDEGAWLTNDAQHALIEMWRGGDDDAKNAWLDAFLAAVEDVS